MKMYGLKFKEADGLLGFYASANPEDSESTAVSYELAAVGEGIWIVPSKKAAEFVAKNDTPWFNADYSTPMNDYVGKVEVVEVEINIQSFSH